jgi:hypothetical protein
VMFLLLWCSRLLNLKSYRYQYPAFAALGGNAHHPLSRF